MKIKLNSESLESNLKPLTALSQGIMFPLILI